MKFKIRDATAEPEESTLELWLEHRANEVDGVRLMGRQDGGPTFALLDIGPEGVYRYSGCSPLGLPLDPIGRVRDTTPTP